LLLKDALKKLFFVFFPREPGGVALDDAIVVLESASLHLPRERVEGGG